MGNGITQVVAAAGYNLVLCDMSIDVVTHGYQVIEKRVMTDVQKEKMDISAGKELLRKVCLTDRYEDLADIDVIFEAIFERIDVKKHYTADWTKFVNRRAYSPLTHLALA